MSESKNLVSVGAGIAGRNKRYVVWFYLLNLAFAHFGASAFNDQARGILDHSLYADFFKCWRARNLGRYRPRLTLQ
jgi:hypothetical protein